MCETPLGAPLAVGVWRLKRGPETPSLRQELVTGLSQFAYAIRWLKGLRFWLNYNQPEHPTGSAWRMKRREHLVGGYSSKIGIGYATAHKFGHVDFPT